MQTRLQEMKQTALGQISQAADAQQLQDLRVKYLGKKGELTELLRSMGSLSAEERPVVGQLVNEVREALDEAFGGKQEERRVG